MEKEREGGVMADTDKNGEFFARLGQLLEEYGVEIRSGGIGQGSEGSFIYFDGDEVAYEFCDEYTEEGIVTAEYCKNNFIY